MHVCDGHPGSTDIMLNSQITSFSDALYTCQALGLRAAPEFEAWLEAMQITRAGESGRLNDAPQPVFGDVLRRVT